MGSPTGPNGIPDAVVTFTALADPSIMAKVNTANTASIRVLEKLGFQREALFRENHWNGVAFEDTAVYSLLTPG